MELPEGALVRLGERGRELLSGRGKVVSESHRGELEATEEPHKSVGGDTVLLLRVLSLVKGEEGLKGGSLGRVGEVVGAHLL